MKIAYLAPEIPALSATFVYNEILQLEQLGIEVVPFSVHHPSFEANDTKLKDLKKRVIHIYERSSLKILFDHLRLLFAHPIRYVSTIKLLLSDMYELRICSRNAFGLVYRFFYAGYVANQMLTKQCRHIHVHFAHVPTDIAMYAASLADISFSVTAHANDLFERGWLLANKINRSEFFATISEFNKRYLKGLGIDTIKVCIVRCGVDPKQFAMREEFTSNHLIRIGVVGRMVEKKGIDTLIKAVALLKKKGRNIELLIAGSGPLEQELLELLESYDLTSQDVTFLGAIPHTQVAEFIKSLDAFVLPCKQDSRGDMDGIPVVLMEAMLSGVPVISTELSGIPELIINNDTGLLVSPDDDQALADAIAKLVDEKELQKRVIKRAILIVEKEFSLNKNTQKLHTLFCTAVDGRYDA